jgi:hypothetical protein
MVTLYGDIEAAFEEHIDFKNVRHHHLGGLFEWFMQLEATRRRVDDEQIAGHMLSDMEMRRMVYTCLYICLSVYV